MISTLIAIINFVLITAAILGVWILGWLMVEMLICTYIGGYTHD